MISLDLKHTMDVGRQTFDPAEYDSYNAVIKALDRRLRTAMNANRNGEDVDLTEINSQARRDLRKADRHFNDVSDIDTVTTLANAATVAHLRKQIVERSSYMGKILESVAKDQNGRFPFPSQYISFRNFLADNQDLIEPLAQEAGLD